MVDSSLKALFGALSALTHDLSALTQTIIPTNVEDTNSSSHRY